MGAVSLTRRLLAALLLAGSCVVVLGAPAMAACPARPASTQSHVMDASDVFSGSVADRRRAGDQVVYTVAVDRVYKGSVGAPEVEVSTERSRRGCGLPDLRPGAHYVFFATAGGSALTTDQRNGTARATGDLTGKVERILGDGSPPTPPAPIEATFTTVADEPTSLQRLAAPGLALVIVGVLGLALVAGLGRRR
jgi:hypothetical protein